MQQITVGICRFAVHTGRWAVAVNWNFDIKKKSDWSLGNFPGIFQCRAKGVDGGYNMINFFFAGWSSVNAIVDVSAVTFRFGSIMMVKKLIFDVTYETIYTTLNFCIMSVPLSFWFKAQKTILSFALLGRRIQSQLVDDFSSQAIKDYYVRWEVCKNVNCLLDLSPHIPNSPSIPHSRYGPCFADV